MTIVNYDTPPFFVCKKMRIMFYVYMYRSLKVKR